jgi:hypothetical protein
MDRYDDAAEHYQIGFRFHEELGENPLALGDASARTPMRRGRSDRCLMGWWA